MGAIAGVIFFLVVLVVGLCGIGLGVAGLIVNRILKKRQKKAHRVIGVLSIVAIAVSSVITLLPVGFFSFIIYVNSTPPDGFVETDIVIEENGYQSERFTADGTVYVALSFEGDYDYISEHSHPVFSYKTVGLMNGSQCGNYYRVDNDYGFTLICDDMSTLFCPEDEKDAIEAFYADESRQSYFCNGEKIPEELDSKLNESLNYEEDTTVIPRDGLDEITIEKRSDDGIVVFDFYCLISYNGSLYLIHISRYDTVDASELPRDVSNEILAFLNKKKGAVSF